MDTKETPAISNLQDSIIIYGITKQGKKFRPSDWADRLSGILSSFDVDNRLSYNVHVHPITVHKVNGVQVDKKLKYLNESMYQFLVDFAQDNELKVFDGCLPTLEDSQTVQKTKTTADQASPFTIREVMADETYRVFNVMNTLRNQQKELQDFVNAVNQNLRPTGYRLIAIFEEGKDQAVAVLGYRISCNLSWGNYINIEDIATLPEMRDKGLGTMLINHMKEMSEKLGRLTIQTDAKVTEDRQPSHRLYFNCGFRIASYHFLYKP